MEEYVPSNLDPVQEVIQQVRSLKNPNMRDSDCQALEKRFYDQDWVTQLDIYELWLDIDNRYTLNCLYCRLCSGYWELLQELIFMKGSVRAKKIAARIEQNCIAHIRMQIIAYFVTTYMPIDIIRKYKKLLSRYLEMAYLSLAERLGGDSDFKIDKDRLVPLLAYYRICEKFNLKTSDEEALSDFKKFMEYNYMQLRLDFPQSEYDMVLNMSLLQNADIKRWYHSIKALNLHRVSKAFERFDNQLQDRIKSKFNEDTSCVDFPGLPVERQYQYWNIFINMAFDEIKNSCHPEDTLRSLLNNNPSLSQFIENFDCKIEDPLSLK